MATNEELIKKADWALSDLTATTGLLSPTQNASFIRKLQTVPTLLNACRFVEMPGPTYKINKIEFGSRIMQAATTETGLAVGNRSKATTSQIQLDSSEVIAEIRLPYEVIEDNIERGNIGQRTDVGGAGAGSGILDTLMALIAERAAIDLEELAVLGDTGSGDAYLALQEGWLDLVQTGGNTVNNASAGIGKAMFKNANQTLPDQYLRRKAEMRHYISFDNDTEYRDTLADRQTGYGDSVLQGHGPVYAFGSAVEPVSVMPETEGLFTAPKNLIFGVQRKIHLEYEKLISERVFKFVLTARVAVQVEETDAAVHYANI